MEQRLSFVTLAITDLDASHRFYVDGLGWMPEFRGDDVIMFEVADKVVLSLWDVEAFTAEVGARPAAGVPPITLAHNVASPAAVDEVLTTAAAVGADCSPGEHREWGGYSGYFVDPDGFRWEVAYNPGDLGTWVLP